MRTLLLILAALTLHSATPEDILGPSLPWNTSPWPGYELNAKANADDIGPAGLFTQPTALTTPLSCTMELKNTTPMTLEGSCASEATPLTVISLTSTNPVVMTVAAVPSWIEVGVWTTMSGFAGTGCTSFNRTGGQNPQLVTAFTSTTITFASGSLGTSCTGYTPNSGIIEPQLMIYTNTPEGNGTGRWLFTANSVSGNTITAAAYCGSCGFGTGDISTATGLLASTRTGLTVYHCKECWTLSRGTFGWGWTNASSGSQANWCHYDPALGLYRMHYRTAGDTYYLGLARQWADACRKWHLSSFQGFEYFTYGYTGAAVMSNIVRAMDGVPEIFDELYPFMTVVYDQNRNAMYPDHNDTRGSAYFGLLVAALAKADPDSDHHAAYCDMVEDIAPKWVELQSPDGIWYEKSNQYSYVEMTGASPWRMFPAFQQLAYAYDVLNDTTSDGCNNTTMAADILAALELTATYLHDAGFDATGKVGFYDFDFPNDSINLTTTIAGTVSATTVGSSTTVTGSGTAFLTAFACNGTDFIGIYDGSVNVRWTYKVASCASDTSLTLDRPYASGCLIDRYSNQIPSLNHLVDLCASTVSNTSAERTPSALTDCGTSIANFCSATQSSTFLLELPWLFGWLYSRTHDSSWITKGDAIAGAAFGTHADGAQGSSACAGPGCVATDNGYSANLRSCAQNGNVPPCATNNVVAFPTGCGTPNGTTCFWGNSTSDGASRSWAQGDGIGGFPAYLAWREMTFDTPTGAPVSLTGAVGLTGNATTH